MEQYKNLDYIKQMIMGESRHQFIYSYDNEQRKKFLRELDNEFPIKADCNSPMAIYLDDIGLPKIPINREELDSDKISTLSREYLTFSIAHAILMKSKNNIEMDLLNSRIDKLLNFINKCYINDGHSKISDLEHLIQTLEQSKEFYKNYYDEYVRTGTTELSIRDLTLPFLFFEFFVQQYKRILNNESYFCIIIDKSSDILLESTKSINLLLGARINRDVSMKVAVEPDKWDSYIDLNGQYIEYIHDYGVVELDNSQKEYIKKLKMLHN